MLCPHCGTQNADDAGFCVSCGNVLNAPAPSPAPAPIKDYQTANIIVAIASFLCCGGVLGVIFGVLGIVFGSQAKAAVSAGRLDEAATHAKNAKLMFILGLVMIGVTLLLTIAIGALYGTLIAAVMQEMPALW